jgi:hypothetical protein
MNFHYFRTVYLAKSSQGKGVLKGKRENKLKEGKSETKKKIKGGKGAEVERER